MDKKMVHTLQAITLTEKLMDTAHTCPIPETKLEGHLLTQVRIELNRAGFRKISEAYEYLTRKMNDEYGY